MYTFEQRALAASAVVLGGMTPEGACEALGFPRSPRTVARWAKELRSTGGIHGGYGDHEPLAVDAEGVAAVAEGERRHASVDVFANVEIDKRGWYRFSVPCP